MNTMIDHSGEPVPAPAYQFSADDSIVLLVGPEEKRMIVHRPQITAHSEFFRAALKREWIEGQTREIKLPVDEPEVVAHYVEYVYFNKLPTDIYTKASPGVSKQVGYEILAQLYVLAERLLDSKCRNEILQEILRLTQLKCSLGFGWYPTWAPINIIYSGTTSGSPARRLLLHLHASHAHNHESWYPKDAQLDPEFLMDLVRELLDRAQGSTELKDIEAKYYFV